MENGNRFHVDRITLAVTRVDPMVRFFERVFDAHLEARPAFGTTLYEGVAHGLPYRLCPNDVAGVEATRSRHQLEIVVDDLDCVLERIPAAGGAVRGEALVDGRRMASATDPDGNTWVFMEPSAP